jgi:glycosyltransferase involved in cell wall biosynthesis
VIPGVNYGDVDGQDARPERLRFLYFTPSDLLVPRVDRTCIMRFCEALARRGCDVEAVSLNVHVDFDEPTGTRDLFEVYGLRTRFRVTTLPSFARQSSDRRSRLWRSAVYGVHAWRRLRRARDGVTVAYFKNYLIGVPLLFLRELFGSRRLLLFFEIHVPPSHTIGRKLLQRFDGVIPVSRILADELEGMGLSPERILAAHQGVDLEYVERIRLDKHAARAKLALPDDRRLVVYTGKVHSTSREIALLLQTADLLPNDVEIVIVGGRSDQVAELRSRLETRRQPRVRFVEFVAPADVFHYQMAADALVTYYPSSLNLDRYLSPGKLFEYMAAQRPIVSADYPALRDVLGPNAAVFVECDNPSALAKAIVDLLNDEPRAAALARNAYNIVKQYDWGRRAFRICSFASKLADEVQTR